MTDPQTLAFYAKNYKNYAKRISGGSGPPVELLEKLAVPKSRIIDIGCGSGQDIVRLAKKGFILTGVEPSKGLRNLAESHCKKNNVISFIRDYSLPNLLRVPERFHGGVLCSGVIHHLEPKYHIDSFAALLNLLESGGVLVISSRTSSNGELREEDGRAYYPVDWDTLLSDKILLEKFGSKQNPARKHEVVERFVDGLWTTIAIRAWKK